MNLSLAIAGLASAAVVGQMARIISGPYKGDVGLLISRGLVPGTVRVDVGYAIRMVPVTAVRMESRTAGLGARRVDAWASR